MTTDELRNLAIGVPFIKGQPTPVYNCWHFSTDGTGLDWMFCDEQDLREGMNRIYLTWHGTTVIILAFVLMDTHIHFILYGSREDCYRFVREYIRRTSIYIRNKYGLSHKLRQVTISCQPVDNDQYLKTVIAYVLRNPVVAGLPCNAFDYPWSSASLYFRMGNQWTSPKWTDSLSHDAVSLFDATQLRYYKKQGINFEELTTIGKLIFPGEYTDSKTVEAIYRTPRSLSYFMNSSKEAEVESKEGVIARLSIPMQELRQIRDELSMEMFGVVGLRSLNASQRFRLAKALKHKCGNYVKQICRACGLVYKEVKDLL